MTYLSRECCADSFAVCIIRRSRHSFKPRAASVRNTTVTAHIQSFRRKSDSGANPLIRTVAGPGLQIDFAEPAASPSVSIKPKLGSRRAGSDIAIGFFARRIIRSGFFLSPENSERGRRKPSTQCRSGGKIEMATEVLDEVVHFSGHRRRGCAGRRKACHASCPASKGCHTWGHTYLEALANIRKRSTFTSRISWRPEKRSR